MPRLKPRLIIRASRIDPLIVKLLPECREIESAQNELKWLREHAQTVYAQRSKHFDATKPLGGWLSLFEGYVTQRARGKPLQYLLGTQPFGKLAILCRPGVLIPRVATEDYVEVLCQEIIELNRHVLKLSRIPRKNAPADQWYHQPQHIKVLDVCTGTGCIALGVYEGLFRNALASLGASVEVLGFDKSQLAVDLAVKNRDYNAKHFLPAKEAWTSRQYQKKIRFEVADLLNQERIDVDGDSEPSIYDCLRNSKGNRPQWDILVSNPPYISQQSYSNGTTTRSVRRFEPVSALIPKSRNPNSLQHRFNPVHGDEFYPHLIDLADFVQARVSLFEVGDTQQARNVVEYIKAKIAESFPNNPMQPAEHLIEVWQDRTLDGTNHPDPYGPIRAVTIALDAEAHGSATYAADIAHFRVRVPLGKWESKDDFMDVLEAGGEHVGFLFVSDIDSTATEDGGLVEETEELVGVRGVGAVDALKPRFVFLEFEPATGLEVGVTDLVESWPVSNPTAESPGVDEGKWLLVQPFVVHILDFKLAIRRDPVRLDGEQVSSKNGCFGKAFGEVDGPFTSSGTDIKYSANVVGVKRRYEKSAIKSKVVDYVGEVKFILF